MGAALPVSAALAVPSTRSALGTTGRMEGSRAGFRSSRAPSGTAAATAITGPPAFPLIVIPGEYDLRLVIGSVEGPKLWIISPRYGQGRLPCRMAKTDGPLGIRDLREACFFSASRREMIRSISLATSFTSEFVTG